METNHATHDASPIQLGLRKDGAEFGQAFEITDNDCDMNRLLLPSSIMRMCQQLATKHCDAIGMDADFYERTHTAFLLAKVAFAWQRIPKVADRIAIVTRPEKHKRGVFKRINEVYDETGTEIGLMDSRWVLVDSQTWRIFRHLPESYENVPYTETIDRALDMSLPRNLGLECCATLRAPFSFCDQNHHVNNTRYADLVCDVLPAALMRTTPVTHWLINYRREILFDEPFVIERTQLEDGSWFVQGSTCDDAGEKSALKANFEALMGFART